jgi:hypothetical protein
MYSQQQIKELLDSGRIPVDQDKIIESGTLIACDGHTVSYDLYCGWDFVLARACDREWGNFNLALMEFIQNQKHSQEELEKILAVVQLEDAHWDWLSKSALHNSNEYVWFFIAAEGKPQGACLIYHPQKSALTDDDIFYIEYVAVAPWNRKNPMTPKSFSGVGSLLIKAAIKHATIKLGLKHGFSLHALAQAASFYEKIGMTPQPNLDKPRLRYFEMSNSTAMTYMGEK